VRKAQAAIALQVFKVGIIVGCMHIVPTIATASMTGDGQNERWMIHRHIDLVSWNDVYN
jgi:hypothetical protein